MDIRYKFLKTCIKEEKNEYKKFIYKMLFDNYGEGWENIAYDISLGGMNEGYPKFTYYKEIELLFNKYQDEIFDILDEYVKYEKHLEIYDYNTPILVYLVWTSAKIIIEKLYKDFHNHINC
ncbi:MAG: hypothetical protein N2505_06175 [Endomicrobia bacterium]|nr:hypothetical protein [Endomicrobiia bacterium]